MPTLVIGDDHTLFADALSTVLAQQGFDVLDIAHTFNRTVAVVGRLQPDVCLIDRHFTDGDSTRLIARLVIACPTTKIVVLTADRDPQGMLHAMSAGATGYVHKSQGLATLFGAIRRAYAGDTVVELPSATPARTGRDMDVIRLAAYLTGRERQCLALLAEGLSTVAMARRLGVSATTVRSHVQAVLTKLGVHSRLQAASLAVRHSLLDDVGLAAPREGPDAGRLDNSNSA